MFNLLSAIWQWLSSIFQSVFTLLENLFKGVVSLIVNTPKALEVVTASFGALPSVVAVFATASVAVYIAYLIIGRSTNE